MENWDEIRTAYQVARLGTVSGAAEVLGVHHATVIRHIDALETRIGVKLFQRHARGYTATEAGQDLARVAQATDDQLSQLAGRIKGRGAEVSGELVVTSLVGFSALMTPVIAAFQRTYPDVTVRYLTGERLFRLEYGEAHVAVRAGRAPDQPDNVVQPFCSVAYGLFASRDYVSRHGQPSGPDTFAGHRFVAFDDLDVRAGFQQWLRQHVTTEQIAFRSNEKRAMDAAIRAGIGIGFLETSKAGNDDDLVEIMPPQESWASALWLVTHVDLHRTAKVQAFLGFLKDYAAGVKR
ncbi:LysR family transcriptional regulator [Primorskyibacter flagellatus]|uniref:LysR family transcriptional regulator n=1 Tax=Primorskyibacter flagellatus TaxID=1387277 RepID=UPI003A8DCBA8